MIKRLIFITAALTLSATSMAGRMDPVMIASCENPFEAKLISFGERFMLYAGEDEGGELFDMAKPGSKALVLSSAPEIRSGRRRINVYVLDLEGFFARAVWDTKKKEFKKVAGCEE